MKPIGTPRLILRGFRADDADGLLDILAVPRAACFEDEKLSGLAEARDSAIRRSRETAGSQVAVCLKGRDMLIGYLFGQAESPDTWSVGWNFNAAFCGNGYALEAARAYLDFLFSEMGARRIYAYVDAENARSMRLCQRLGMRREGILKEFISFSTDRQDREIYEDTCIYAILAREWREKRFPEGPHSWPDAGRAGSPIKE